ncbi:hypothetical protein [Limobrevibacterium gyesilva]|uniref:Uncharacterized protein n=1 Tax=Limobrevibacterium gyesilva TaxID=2991712 RepID=A0AA41YRN7_9PROT|nr:hypothetical protein [Limobrevibacterium gyesilva]MCW3474267.1 hypothetical protein [Limobrevibacterium gyesilva]
MTTDAELRGLLLDCLRLWDIAGAVTATADGLRVETATAACTIRRGPAPTRWFLATPTRTRPSPSIVALLSALRRALGADPGIRARIGAGAGIGLR